MSCRICSGWISRATSLPMRPGLIRHRPFSFGTALQQQQQLVRPVKDISRRRPGQYHSRHGAGPKPPTVLRAHIYGTLFLSIALLVPDESLSWDARCDLGIKTVQDIVRPATYAEKKHEFMMTGAALLALYSGGQADDVQVHEKPLVATPESQMEGQLQNLVLTAPDPEVEGGTLLLCQSVFVDDHEPEFYVSAHGSMNNDAAEALIPPFEDFARALRAAGGGPVRGAMLLLQASGDWKCIYWDGKRWFNLIFLEWQTAESMGFVEG